MKQITYLLITSLLFFIACKKDKTRIPDTSYKPDVNIKKFTNSTNLTNTYFPVAAGKKYIYEGQTKDGLEKIEEQRLPDTKTILGITCIIVNFKAFLNGTLIEEAWDWYAQDSDGNVWYFGRCAVFDRRRRRAGSQHPGKSGVSSHQAPTGFRPHCAPGPQRRRASCQSAHLRVAGDPRRASSR